jgi:N-acetylated-alpha-linked acidic dipeptidase
LAIDIVPTQWEEYFIAQPNATIARSHLQYYTSIAHIAGSVNDYKTAVYTRDQIKSYGIQNVEIREFPAYLSYPISRSVKMLSPSPFTAVMQEPAYPQDKTSNDTDAVMTFLGYSPSGNATAEVVFANYGTLEDFEYLASHNVSVKGKIVLTRYGQIFRGLKVFIAEIYGAAGVLIYSDPQDDGFTQGTVYPNGPWRPEQGVQRGSTAFLNLCAGDPSPARKALCLGNDSKFKTLSPSIPCLPLSWGDALPILQNLSGPVNSAWKGGLDVNYNIGPGPAIVEMVVNMTFNTTSLWNVIATIPGESDQTVVLGNHRDAWVFGAADPNSGTAALLEVARSFGLMLGKGWKPKRTVVLASWDGEEYGLIGSTHFAENEASPNTVAYLNCDVAVTGPVLGIAATASLSSLVRYAATRVVDPNTGKNLSDIWDGSVYPLGSGSDFVGFLDRLGIASVDMGFNGNYGVYHSIYDSFYWMDNFGDPNFTYHRLAAQYWGVVALTLVDSAVLPFDYADTVIALNGFLVDLNNLILATDSSRVNVLDPIRDALDDFNASVIGYKERVATGDFNEQLYKTERKFLYSEGLPNRPWFRHMIQAPGMFAGYAADTFPAVTEAVREQDWETAKKYSGIIAECITNAGEFDRLPEDKPAGKPWWMYFLIVLGALIAIAALVAGIVLYRRRKTHTYESI